MKCCFIGDEIVGDFKKVAFKLRDSILLLIKREHVHNFMFEVSGEFGKLAYSCISILKNQVLPLNRIAFVHNLEPVVLE